MKNKRNILALLIVIIIGIIGTTIAYFTTIETFSNIFSTKPYSVKIEEEFTNPNDWTPGTTTNKIIKAINTGEVDVAVRISYEESWIDSQNNPLPLEENGIRASIINFTPGYRANWIKETTNDTDYYYYNTALSKNDCTTNLIDSITFNPAVQGKLSSNCTKNESNQICITYVSGYAGGTYTLTTTVETVQYSDYQTAWQTDIIINSANY